MCAKEIKRAFFAGSFDPFTNGHLHILTQGLSLFDEIVVAIGQNIEKNNLWSAAERCAMIKQLVVEQFSHASERVQVIVFSGLLVEAARTYQANILLRGVRSVSDFEYEMQMVEVNYLLKGDLQTVWIPTTDEARAIRSTTVRQIAAMGGDVHAFVPMQIAKALQEKFK